MSALLRFGTKVGILSGAILYSRQIGVWDDSTKTYDLSRDVIVYSKPYISTAIRKVDTELPIQFQDLPTISDLNRSLVNYWNKGVIISFNFIANSPNTIKSYINDGFVFVLKELQREKKIELAEKSESS